MHATKDTSRRDDRRGLLKGASLNGAIQRLLREDQGWHGLQPALRRPAGQHVPERALGLPSSRASFVYLQRHEEVISAGEAYYAPPATVACLEDAETVEFSPTADFQDHGGRRQNIRRC